MVRTFCQWLLDQHIIDADPTRSFYRNLHKRYPRIYGKHQAAHPARFLTYDEAFGQLLTACRDQTWIGSRDQLVIRLGLLGLRVSELARLTWGHYHHGAIVITGKGNRIREVRPGPTLTYLLDRWRRHYEHQLGRPLITTDALLPRCTNRPFGPGGTQAPRSIDYGRPMTTQALRVIIAHRADLAGLGWVAPHDLRRSAANILHTATSPDGGHLYDLLDIQKVLDHADPATTQRSYLDMLDTTVKTRAGATLD